MSMPYYKEEGGPKNRSLCQILVDFFLSYSHIWGQCYAFKNNLPKIGVLTQNNAKLCKKRIVTLALKKNNEFLISENRQKLLKFVIITLAPGFYVHENIFFLVKSLPVAI
jgi:hypothetical protein